MVWALMVFGWCVGIAGFARAALAGQVAACFVFVSMCQALLLAIGNQRVARAADDGVLIPLLYLVGGMVSPVTWPSAAGQVAVAGLMVATIACRCWLGVAFTVGGSTWVALRDRGPYAVVRHPLILLDCLGRFAIAGAYGGWLNAASAWAFLGCMLAVIVLEERFLAERPGYAAYSQRVRWRLLPGFW
jgi:protein-S-isoprenylcysteine O-methyltransferase Ste14